MGKIKIHEIAKEIGLASKEIIERAQKLGISVTSHLSSIDEDQAKTIKESFGTSKKQNDGEKTAKAKEQKDTKKESSPVIIRREVIISEEEERKNIEKQKRNEEHAKNVGFVERNNNKDYNIVYRNKQTKPLTVNELFGIKPKEEKKAEKVEEKKVEVPEKKEEPKEEVKQDVKQVPVQKEVVENKENVQTINKENNFAQKERNNNYQERSNNFRDSRNMNNNRNNNFRNQNGENRNNGYRNNQYGDNRNNNFRNQNGENRNNDYRNNGYRNGQNGDNRNNNFRNNQNDRFNQNRDGRDNRGQFNRNRPLDEKGIDKNIKNIMTTEIVEKELQRDYSNKVIEKQKISQDNIEIKRTQLQPKCKVKHYANEYVYEITNNTGKDIIINSVASSEIIGLSQIAAYTAIPRGMDFVPIWGLVYGIQTDLEKNKFTRPHPINEIIKNNSTMRVLALSKKTDNPIVNFYFTKDDKQIKFIYEPNNGEKL